MILFTLFLKDPPIEINDTYKAYRYLSEDNLFVKWPDVESMPPGDYDEYNNTNMMGSVSSFRFQGTFTRYEIQPSPIFSPLIFSIVSMVTG